MKSYAVVSRKTVREDRIAICPKFGCENLIRVKPLKLGFLGFGRYPKCKKHHIPLVYVDERIGDFVDAALSCLFDISGLPPNELLSNIKKEIPEEVESFIKKWVYCITTGRGAPKISQYIDSISNSYLKLLSKKQLRSLKNENTSKKAELYQGIKKGLQEITNQYTRLLRHLRIHHEVFNGPNKLKSVSNRLKKILNDWLESSKQAEKELLSMENIQDTPLLETKEYYDFILNMGIVICLLGYSTKKRENMTKKITAFDRFNAYYDFFSNGLTKKFTKNDIQELLRTILINSKDKLKTINAFGRNLPVNILGLKLIIREQLSTDRYTKKSDFLDMDFIDTLNPPSNPSKSNVNEWFTQVLLGTMKQYVFLKKFASLRSMSSFFGLSKSYLYDKKYKKSVISHESLDKMKDNVIKFIDDIIKKERNITEKPIKARNQLISVIETYRQKYNPKLTANTQINENLNTSFFHNISLPIQAYYLGLLFADGWITILKSNGGGSTSYRISLSLKVEDKPVIERFSETIGLDTSRVLERDSIDQRTGKIYRMTYIQFGVGSTSIKISMAHDLMNLGMTYKKNDKGKRSKVPILPVFCDINGNVNRKLMLAFLLGYFDGDGTLKDYYSGEIYSNNYNFFSAIKEIFNLGKISKAKRVVFDPTTKTHTERTLYSLFLNKEIFKEMMSLGLESMERKVIETDLIDLDAPIMTKQRKWLKDKFPLNYLKEVLTTHSPSKIAELIGVDHNTFLNFLKVVYDIVPQEKGYYIRLSYERKKNPKLNQIYKEKTYQLLEIGKKNPFNYQK